MPLQYTPSNMPSKYRGLGLDPNLCKALRDELLQDSQYAYPKLEPKKALFQHICHERIENVFFRDGEGRRCVWRKPITYLSSKDFVSHKYQLLFDENQRHFVVPKYKQTSKKPHPSKSGWDLPADHSRHFNKLPEEIQEKILALCLVDPAEKSKPRTIPCDWKVYQNIPSYQPEGWMPKAYHHNVQELQKSDIYGPYTEMRVVKLPRSDVSLLRVNKHFLACGADILYRETDFHFSLTKMDHDGCPPTCRGLWPQYYSNRLYPFKPVVDRAFEVILGIVQMHQQNRLAFLVGWLYHDPLLNFLWTIGRVNASRIRSLTIHGVVHYGKCPPNCLHNHRNGSCGEDDLARALSLYVIFLREFVPQLRTLTIDMGQPGQVKTAAILSPGQFRSTEEATAALFGHQLKCLDSLDELIILGPDPSWPPAASIVNWFDERRQRRLRLRSHEALCISTGTVDACCPHHYF